LIISLLIFRQLEGYLTNNQPNTIPPRSIVIQK